MSGSHRIQRNIRCSIIEEDRFGRTGATLRSSINIIGGLDISFSSNDNQTAVAALSLYNYGTMQHMHTFKIPVKITVPYKSGFLAYREVEHYVTLLETLKKEHPQWKPQVLLVDGNGILHHRGCGSASHLGVVADVPTIGVAKKLLIPAVQARSERQFREDNIKHLCQNRGTAPVIGKGKTGIIGVASVNKGGSTPVYISVGHRVSLNTAVRIVQQCYRGNCRIPAPIDSADQESRQQIGARTRDTRPRVNAKPRDRNSYHGPVQQVDMDTSGGKDSTTSTTHDVQQETPNTAPLKAQPSDNAQGTPGFPARLRGKAAHNSPDDEGFTSATGKHTFKPKPSANAQGTPCFPARLRGKAAHTSSDDKGFTSATGKHTFKPKASPSVQHITRSTGNMGYGSISHQEGEAFGTHCSYPQRKR
ncbi:endonuclease V-like [Sycon ciliatum]|uniref:endonuclease V-like n=1 Tax=Sycon ciliatum TaxID=27933 RepID=UPI0031F696D5